MIWTGQSSVLLGLLVLWAGITAHHVVEVENSHFDLDQLQEPILVDIDSLKAPVSDEAAGQMIDVGCKGAGIAEQPTVERSPPHPKANFPIQRNGWNPMLMRFFPKSRAFWIVNQIRYGTEKSDG